MKVRLTLSAVAAIAAAAAIGGCSCGSSSTHGGLGGGGSNSNGALVGSGGGLVGSNGTGSGCETHCSGDLHDVVDCNDTVVKHCPMGQGCGAKGCVAPCESAKENKSSIGCDYYAVDPDSISVIQGACYATFIANTWDTPVSIQLERGGTPIDISNAAFIPSGSGQGITYTKLPGGMLPVGEVAILFLSSGSSGGSSAVACPAAATPATNTDGAVHGTGYGQAFHVTTSAPVVAYDIFPYGGGSAAATSATLLLPTSAWDTNYIGVDAFRKSVIVAEAQPFIEIVAAEDDTNVKVSPSAAIVGGGGVPGTGVGVPITYKVNKGQILQFTQDAELIGTIVQSDKPIGMWGGETCLSVDVSNVACDSAHQQIPPVKALGSEYVAVRFRNRHEGVEETPPWRFVGAVAGTTLTYDPPTPPAGAPTTLAEGQVAEFKSAGGFTVKSQNKDHPFYVSAHMEGCQAYDPGEEDCRGDPEFVNVIPPAQFLSSYVFFTDPTYPETNLVLTRKKTKNGFDDVTLDCAGVITGWQDLGTDGQYQFARIDLVTGNFMGVNGCDNGRHEIKSHAPFGLTVWGWGSAASSFYSQAVSYAYPAGASVQPINTVVIPPTPK